MGTTTMASGERVTINQAAELLKVKPYQIWYQIRAKRFTPRHSLGENAYGIDVDEELPVLKKLLQESAARARRRTGRLKYLGGDRSSEGGPKTPSTR